MRILRGSKKTYNPGLPPLLNPVLFTLANHSSKYRFEAQLTAVKERLEAAKAGSTRGLGSPTGGFAFSGSRIAKPLRGGGAGTDGPAIAAPIPTIQGLQNEASGNGGKRGSWFFSGTK